MVEWTLVEVPFCMGKGAGAAGGEGGGACLRNHLAAPHKLTYINFTVWLSHAVSGSYGRTWAYFINNDTIQRLDRG